VVAVLRAAHARLAMAVRHRDEGGLPIGALERQQRADAAAPAALAGEQQAAEERTGDCDGQEYPCGPAAVVEDGDPGAGDAEEEDERDRETVTAQPGRGPERPGETEHPWGLVHGRERADVAP